MLREQFVAGIGQRDPSDSERLLRRFTVTNGFINRSSSIFKHHKIQPSTHINVKRRLICKRSVSRLSKTIGTRARNFHGARRCVNLALSLPPSCPIPPFPTLYEKYALV